MPSRWDDVELGFDEAADRIIQAHAKDGAAQDLPIGDSEDLGHRPLCGSLRSRPLVAWAPCTEAPPVTVLLSLSQAVHETDRASLMKLALAEPGDIFVGVALDASEAAYVRKWLDDSGIEVAAVLNGQHRRQVREKT